MRIQFATPSALSSTRTTCTASRAPLPRVPSAIWCRQLVPSATISVSGVRRAHGRQQRELRHAHRDVVVRGVVAEAARHAAAARLDQLDRELRARAAAPPASAPPRRTPSGGNAPCSSARFCGSAASGSAGVPRACSRARNSSISNALSREPLRGVAEAHHQELVAQRQQARRLEADDRRRRARHAAAARRPRAALRAFASSTRPAARYVRPQHSGRAGSRSPPSARATCTR